MTLKKGFLLFLLTIVSLNIFSEDVKNLMANGVKQYQNGKYIDCIFYMNSVLEEKNNFYSEALFWKAKAQYELGHYSDSKSSLEQLFRKGSIVTAYYEDARFLYCKIFFKLEKYNDSILLLKQFRRNESFTYYGDSALFWIGEGYLQLSNLGDAQEYFKKYLTLKPKSKVVKARLSLIEKMINLLTAVDSAPPSVVDKAGWLTEFVVKEFKDKKVEITDETIGNWLKTFKTKEQFFYYLENSFLEDIKREEPVVIIKEVVAEVDNKSVDVTIDDKPVDDEISVDYITEEVETPVDNSIIETETSDKVDITEDSTTIINEDEQKELNELESKILEELEKKLLNVIGDDS